MRVWELDLLCVAAHQRQMLRYNDADRVVALLLPQGEALQEHDVHEQARVSWCEASCSERRCQRAIAVRSEPEPPRSPEGNEVRAISECQVVICLPLWPGHGCCYEAATA